MKVRYVFLLVAALTLGCGGSDTPTSPSNPGGGGDVVAGPTISCPANVSASTTTTTSQVALLRTHRVRRPGAGHRGLHPGLGRVVPAGLDQRHVAPPPTRCTASATCGFSVTVTRTPDAAAHQLPGLRRQRHRGRGLGADRRSARRLDGFPSFTLTVVPRRVVSDAVAGAAAQRATSRSRQPSRVANSGRAGRARDDTARRRFPGVMSSVRPEVVLLLEGYNDLALLATQHQVRPPPRDREPWPRRRATAARACTSPASPRRARAAERVARGLGHATCNGRLRAVAAGENAVFVDLYQALVGNVTTYIGWTACTPPRSATRRSPRPSSPPSRPPFRTRSLRDATMMPAWPPRSSAHPA